MPTIFKLFGFAFLFYANDHEPIHAHVVKGGGKIHNLPGATCGKPWTQ